MRILGHLLFGALSAGALFVCVTVVAGVLGLVGRPALGFALVEEGLVNPVSLQASGAAQAGFVMWDRILAVDGELVFSTDDVLARALARPPGSLVVYQVVGTDGSERFVEMATRTFTASDVVRTHASLSLLGAVFVVVALLLYFLRPGTAEAWSFFGLFASIGVAMASVVDLTLLWQLPPLYPLLGPFLGTFGIILVGVIVRAYRKTEGQKVLEGAPEDGEPGFEARAFVPQRRMWALTFFCLAASAAVAALMLGKSHDAARYTVIDSIYYSWLFFCTVAALVILALGYLRARSPRRRARIRQILWAWPVGAGIPILNLFMGHVLHLSPMSLIWNGFLLLVPISTADAIVRHDLLRLNRSARRLVGGLTIAAVVGMALGVVLWAAVQFLKLDDAPAMVAMAALLFAVAAPITHRVQSYIEDLLRSRRYDAGRLVAEFTARASTATALSEVLARLEHALSRSIAPQSFELYRLDRAAARLVPQVGQGAVAVDAPVQAWLEHAEPLVVDDEAPAPHALSGAALAVRLAVANEPIGLLVVAHRPEGTPYEDQDVAFVGALAGPLAAALTNSLAFEAVERLNRELEARVQARTQELEQKNDELATLNVRKDELVATISHDFRSPLAVIRQNVQTILRDMHRMERDDVRMFLDGIARQEDRLTALCTNLLDLARLKQRLGPQDPVDMAAVASQLVADLQGAAQARGVALALSVDAAAAPLLVRGDRDRLGQVLQNLVDNALKFTPTGGSVDVELRPAPDDDGAVRLVVQDTGVGVPADALPRLFEPFFQVQSNATAGQGSGLGLAIVKAVVDAHGGTVEVASVLGAGTSFSVSLPRFAPAAEVGHAGPGGTAAAAE